MRLMLLVAVLCVGCGPVSSGNQDRVAQAFKKMPSTAQANRAAGRAARYAADGSEIESAEDSAAADRRIIYTAELEIFVTSFDGVEQKMKSLVESCGGYISSANLDRMSGEHRNASWVVRVPVDNYDSFLDEVSQVGVPTKRNQSAEDVSEQFVDIEARLTNKRKLEARIQQLLERPDDKIQHVIEVERELGRVREEIERFEGRLRYLSDKTSMTTVTIHIKEQREYQPPQSPTLTNRIVAAWSGSTSNLVKFLQNVIVFVAGAIIPFSLLASCAWVVWKIVRKIIGNKTKIPIAQIVDKE